MKKQARRFVYLLLCLMLLATGMTGFPGPVAAITLIPRLPIFNSWVPLSSLAAGDTVNFASYTWIVLDPGTGYLLMQGEYGSLQAFDSINLANPFFDIGSKSNIAYYLNDNSASGGFFNSFSAAEQNVIQSSATWTIGYESNESSSHVNCGIGLLSYSEYVKYQGVSGVNTNVTWWLRTPCSATSGYIWAVKPGGGLFNYPANATYAVRPALYLYPDTLVFGGNGGTVSDSPSVGGVSPDSGPAAGGTKVTISGNSLTGATVVNIGSNPATNVSVASDTSITATSPEGVLLAGSGTVDVTVTTPGGTSATSAADQFTYTAPNTPSQSTPPSGSGSTTLVFTIGSTDYTVNSQAQSMDTAPIISNGRTLLPIRYVATPLNAAVNWDPANQEVTVTLKSTSINLWIGQNSASVNGFSTPIDPNNPAVVPIVVPPGRTMMPMRFIVQNLGCQVDWDPVHQAVTVTYTAS